MSFNKAVRRVGVTRTYTERRQAQRPQMMSDNVVSALTNGVTSRRDLAIIQVLLQSGLRAGELTQLNRGMIWPDATGTGGTGELPRSKSLGIRTFRIGLKAVETLGEYLGVERDQDGSAALFIDDNGNRITVPWLRRMIHHWCDQLGIERISIRSFRDNLAVRLINAGMPIPVFCKLMDYRIPSYAARFIHTSSDFDRNEVSE